MIVLKKDENGYTMPDQEREWLTDPKLVAKDRPERDNPLVTEQSEKGTSGAA